MGVDKVEMLVVEMMSLNYLFRSFLQFQVSLQDRKIEISVINNGWLYPVNKNILAFLTKRLAAIESGGHQMYFYTLLSQCWDKFSEVFAKTTNGIGWVLPG
jgi:hypothetical protein